jgi:hypothetical protein
VSFGHGKVFSGGRGTESWFHIPIPTIVQLDSAPLYLDQFYVFFACEGREAGAIVGIRQVHVWDGSAKVLGYISPTQMAGDWSRPQTVGADSNTWFPRRRGGPEAGQRIRILTGLGISLLGVFEVGGSITFHSAGASWVDSPH